MISEEEIKEVLKQNKDLRLYHRESQTIEYKSSFNLGGLDDYYKDFAAFANNRGGYLIFGVTNNPRTILGLADSSIEQFEKIDPAKISGDLLKIFSGEIINIFHLENINNTKTQIGIIKVIEAKEKPIICKNDSGKKQELKAGEIYYRYGGRTEKIRYKELDSIINQRISEKEDKWFQIFSKIKNIGIENLSILDTEKGVLEFSNTQGLIIDEKLAKEIKFIKEGKFEEKAGATTLKLVGNIKSVETIEIIKNILSEYPLSALELAKKVKEKCTDCTTSIVWKIIKRTNLKGNKKYSMYNFRNKKKEEEFNDTGDIQNGTPSLYNEDAVNYIISQFQSNNE